MITLYSCLEDNWPFRYTKIRKIIFSTPLTFSRDGIMTKAYQLVVKFFVLGIVWFMGSHYHIKSKETTFPTIWSKVTSLLVFCFVFVFSSLPRALWVYLFQFSLKGFAIAFPHIYLVLTRRWAICLPSSIFMCPLQISFKTARDSIFIPMDWLYSRASSIDSFVLLLL